MKIALFIGILWTVLCFFALWVNYRLHRRRPINPYKDCSPEVTSEMESEKRIAGLSR
jgi:hypothetical protein